MTELALEYRTIGGDLVAESFTKAFSTFTNEAPFEQEGVRKTVLLARLVTAMKEAADIYASDPDSAVDQLRAAHAQFEESLRPDDDPGLQAELAFSAELLRLMQEGAPQESFYGGF